MKTKLVIEIETRDITDEDLPVLEEEIGIEEKDLSKESKEYRKDWVKAIHQDVITHIEKYLEDDFEEQFLDNLEEESVDGWDTLEDYGIKVTVSRKDGTK
jgi:hypothetical protein